MGLILWLATIIGYGAIAVCLGRTLNGMVGLGVYAGMTVILMALAGMLLRSVLLGELTWKNRLASFLLPWATFVGGGTLRALLIKNGLASIVFAGVVIAIDRLGMGSQIVGVHPSADGTTDWVGTVVSGLTIFCWLILLVAWMWILRARLRNRPDVISALLTLRGLKLPFILPPIAIGLSVALKLSEYAWSALLVVGLPLLIVLTPVLLMMATLLILKVRGKPIRWN